MLQVDAYVKLVDPDFDDDAQRDMLCTIAALHQVSWSVWGVHALHCMHHRHWRLASILMQPILQTGSSAASLYINLAILMSSHSARLVMESLVFIHAEYMQHFSQHEWLKTLTETVDNVCITPHMRCAAVGLFDSPR